MKIEIRKYLTGLNSNIYLLTLSSFFGDIATEMLYPLLPIFLLQTLRANGSILGMIEGVAQAALYCVQGFSGYLADKLQNRKVIALIGYTVSAIAKPFIGVSVIWPEVLIGRFFDRLGAGTRSAPRDSIITSSVSSSNTGKAFGLEGIGDNLGAFIGPLLTILFFFVLAFDIRTIFYLSIIPGILSILMVIFVKEKKQHGKPPENFGLHFKEFPSVYWRYLLITAIFNIGNSSNAFLILLTKEKGGSLPLTILLYALFNLSAALVSFPSGTSSDKLGRKHLLLISFVIFFISYAGFAVVSDIFLIGVLFVFYGSYQGIFRSVGKSYVTDFIPAHLQSSGIGWYSTVVGLSQLVASVIAGIMWDEVSHPSVFIFGSAAAFLGCISLAILIPSKHKMTY